jgi:hypothetical protein
MAEVVTAPVKATMFDDIDDVSSTPGGFEYFRAGERYPAGMIYSCPCGCGAKGSLNFRPHASPSWEWDGNTEAPTLSPSVHHVGHWHGWLRNGVWESC